jgi:hypothetical protein
LQKVFDTLLLDVIELALFHSANAFLCPANALFHPADALLHPADALLHPTNALFHSTNTLPNSLNIKLKCRKLLNDQGVRISYDYNAVSAVALHHIAQFFEAL